MQSKDIVVLGGSAGSLETVKTIVSALPAQFPASIFLVVHVAADSPSLLHEHISWLERLPATQAVDGEPIRHGHIYVARPDHHLQLESGKIRVLRGPRENRHRPAIDPLFRSAAREFGTRVIGIILSGFHDDGSAGLFAVKELGGVTIAQDPRDAAFPEMPASAIRYADPEYVLPADEIAPKLLQLVHSSTEPIPMSSKQANRKHSKGMSAKKSKRSNEPEANLHAAYNDEGQGNPSVFACPECHGVLWELKDGKMTRYRCRVGHSYTQDTLAQDLSQAFEAALWAAMRALEEKAAMQRRIADGKTQNKLSAARLREQSAADEASARVIRDMILGRDAELERPQAELSANGTEAA